MNRLLDTLALFWWVTDSPLLSVHASSGIRDAEGPVCVSAASVFELSNQLRTGKFEAARELIERLDEVMDTNRFMPLPVTYGHARLAGQLAAPHREPFDRLLEQVLRKCGAVSQQGFAPAY